MSDQTNLYLDPLSQAGFRHIFGQEKQKWILIELLNVIFDGKTRIVNLRILPSALADNENRTLPQPLLELHCIDQDGDSLYVNLQCLKEHTFLKVSNAFVGDHFNSSPPEGKTTGEVPEDRFLISFLDFNLTERLKYLQLKGVTSSRNRQPHASSGVLGFKFMQTHRFGILPEELETDLEKWIYLLKNLSELKSPPPQFDAFVFQEVFKVAAFANLTSAEKATYEQELKAEQEFRQSAAYLEEKQAYEAEKEKNELRDFEDFLRDISRMMVMKISRISKKEAEAYLQKLRKRKR